MRILNFYGIVKTVEAKKFTTTFPLPPLPRSASQDRMQQIDSGHHFQRWANKPKLTSTLFQKAGFPGEEHKPLCCSDAQGSWPFRQDAHRSNRPITERRRPTCIKRNIKKTHTHTHTHTQRPKASSIQQTHGKQPRVRNSLQKHNNNNGQNNLSIMSFFPGSRRPCQVLHSLHCLFRVSGDNKELIIHRR